MSYLLGIDIGTSGTKSVVMDESGTVQGSALYEYNIDTPNPGWAEQNPLVWWQGTVDTLRRVLANAHIDSQEIAGIGFSGQMHGTVFLDESFNVIRPAIIWADQRSAPQCRKIYNEVGQDRLARLTANPIAPGLTLAVGLDSSAAEQVAVWAPGAQVVKAFNTTGYNVMRDPLFDGISASMFFCGDDPQAKAACRRLIEALGFDPIDCGALAMARYLEPMALMWINLTRTPGLSREIAFKLLRR